MNKPNKETLQRMKRCDNLDKLATSPALTGCVGATWAERGDELFDQKEYEAAAIFYRRALRLVLTATGNKEHDT